MRIEDETLLASHVAGDPLAFAELVGRHRERLVQFVTGRLGGDGATAEDVVQVLWLKIARYAHTFNPAAAFRPWLYSMCDRIVRDTRRMKRRTASRFVPYQE